ncbi:hypothetical protein CVU76_00470 [Candidatus Dojkabacteria bacterium HGW-Dojkabacteria-1]|uniref:Peptidase S24/S26A/S26B/S26C domain-containing protein n=1 Tax=Candidatus Dojkabacteria bacterium HGW-Dojkabacteria-1 TaxID=2013761 RepID=A0A2N2F2W0_9BACT|nr:MAG: hypothetical protein CVU76_00470 [Candidatus Dojkabacteria bacterium HGW-Dojkabacteria-1]
MTQFHPIQKKIINLLKDQGSVPLRYREIGRRIGERYPQTVKHHINKLLDNNLVIIQNDNLILNKKSTENIHFATLPYYGLATCGPASIFAEDKIQGYIKISRNFLPKMNIEGLYLVKATGNSMNMAKVGANNRNIEDGDLVVIDPRDKDVQNGDYVLSVIEDFANIKKFTLLEDSSQAALISESTDEYLPIILHEEDNFFAAGKVVDVIKL